MERTGTARLRGRGATITAAGVAAAATLSLGATGGRPQSPLPPFGGPQAGGFLQYWTAVGSTGAVDPEDLGIVKTRESEIFIPNNAAAPARLNVRYNVTPVRNLTVPDGERYAISMVYRDNGEGARIIARLKRVDRIGGETTTLLTLDSDAFAPSDDFQEQAVIVNDPEWDFNFSLAGYFIDVTITRLSSEGDPRLRIIQTGTFF